MRACVGCFRTCDEIHSPRPEMALCVWICVRTVVLSVSDAVSPSSACCQRDMTPFAFGIRKGCLYNVSGGTLVHVLPYNTVARVNYLVFGHKPEMVRC